MSLRIKELAMLLLCKFIAIIRSINKPNKGTIFLAPDIPVTNLGDQALLLGALEGLILEGCAPIYVVANGPEKISSIPRIEVFSKKITIIQDWNVMFATDRAFFEALAFYWLTRKVTSIVLVGADVLDGRYNPREAGRKLAIIEKCISIGLHAKIVGFSLSENISDASANGFKQLAGKAEFISRDPVSQQRMLAFSPCALGADCAFLMKPNSLSVVQDKKLVSWLESSSFTVALCLRDEDFMTEETSPFLHGFVSGLIDALEQQKANLLLIPHHPVDIVMLSKVVELLDELNFKRYFLLSDLPCAQDIKAYVSQCEHIITSRMHVAIASLGMERAITCLPYAGKFEGLYQHFALENTGLDRTRIGDSDYVSSVLSMRFETSQDIEKHIKVVLPQVKVLSQSNFKGLRLPNS